MTRHIFVLRVCVGQVVRKLVHRKLVHYELVHCALLAFLGFYACIALHSIAIQSASANPTTKRIDKLQASYVKALFPRSTVEVLEWQALMEEGSYQLDPSVVGKFKLIFHLENVLNKRCLARLPWSLKYDGKTEDKSCLELIEKLLKLDAENAPALCARDGINAANCRDAYLRQVVWTAGEVYRVKREKIGTDMSKYTSAAEAVIKDNKNPDIFTVSNRNRIDYQNDKSFEKYLELNESYGKLLGYLCKPLGMIIVNREEALGNFTVAPTPRPTLAKSFYANPELEPPDRKQYVPRKTPNRNSPLKELQDKLDKPDKNKPGEDRLPPEATQVRVRIISYECSNHLDQLFKVEKNTPVIVCARDGIFTPFCIDALSRDRKRLKVMQQAAAKKLAAMNKEENPAATPKPPSDRGIVKF